MDLFIKWWKSLPFRERGEHPAVTARAAYHAALIYAADLCEESGAQRQADVLREQAENCKEFRP